MIQAEYTGTGRLNVWKDGVKVINNCTTATSAGDINYPKFGIYRKGGEGLGTAIMYGDAYRIGTTYASVAPEIAR